MNGSLIGLALEIKERFDYSSMEYANSMQRDSKEFIQKMEEEVSAMSSAVKAVLSAYCTNGESAKMQLLEFNLSGFLSEKQHIKLLAFLCFEEQDELSAEEREHMCRMLYFSLVGTNSEEILALDQISTVVLN